MKRGKDVPQSGINVTPLVDVCLVLLIIFMVVAPMLGGRPVRLPETAAPGTLKDEPKPFELSVHADGTLWLGASWFPEGELVAALRERHARATSAPLVLYADRELRFADVRHAMKLAHDAGFAGVALAARKTGPER